MEATYLSTNSTSSPNRGHLHRMSMYCQMFPTHAVPCTYSDVMMSSLCLGPEDLHEAAGFQVLLVQGVGQLLYILERSKVKCLRSKVKW